MANFIGRFANSIYASSPRAENSITYEEYIFKEWSEKLHHYAETGLSKEVLHYWEEQAEQDVVKLPVDGTISNPVSAVTEEITVVLNENETRMLLQETLSTHRVQINEVLLKISTSYGSMYRRPILSVDLEGHGREEIIEDVDLSRTVGWFTSIYPVHLNITSANTPIEALKAVKEQVRKIPNKGVDYGVLRYMNATMCEQLSPNIHRLLVLTILDNLTKCFLAMQCLFRRTNLSA